MRDYLPGFARMIDPDYDLERMLAALGGGRIEPVPIPHDCRDGFLHAYWRRPGAYLDPKVRAGISVCRLLDPDEVAAAVGAAGGGPRERRVGAPQRAPCSTLDELDLGYRLLVSEPET